MKPSKRSPKVVSAVGLAVLTLSAQAGLRVPYTPDDNTIHLWHFDGAFTNANGTTNIVTPDAVASGGVTLTNYGQTFSTFADGSPPSAAYTNISLGNPSFAGLGNALRIFDPTKLASGNQNALAYGGVYGPASTFGNPVSGAFTFEALVKLDADPFLPNNGNWEIISGDGNVNGNNNRGWQFRIQTGASANLNFNAFPGNNAAVNNLTANLPNSGPNATVINQWYHLALTYTGASPTNGDTPGVLTFYWTLLDANRTVADVLLVVNVGAGFGFTTGGNTPLAVGGSGRNFSGTLANNEGFKGYLDEARMSIVALRSNEMAFSAGGALNPAKVLQQPPTNTVAGFGQPLTVAALVSGTQPYSVQWQQNGAGGYTNAPGQMNSALQINSTTFSAAGDYRLVVSNAYGGDTSIVAHVTVLASLNELFASGVDTNSTLPVGGAGVVDLHYLMTESADTNNLGPDSLIWNMGAYPIAASGGNFENPDGVSQWIGPRANASSTTSGRYVFRTEFLVDTGDPSTAKIQGIWWVNTAGSDILLNGNSTGLRNTVAYKPGTGFAITNGFIPGLNALDFVVTNSGAGGAFPQTGFRVEMSGLAQPLPPGKATITNQPANVAVRENGHATFSVVALGRPPLSYQWWADNTLLTGSTNRTLAFNPAFSGGQGTNFQVVVSNDSGSVTSSVAKLTLVPTNRPPVPASFNLVTYSNLPVNLYLPTVLQLATDADHDPIAFFSADSTSTNFGSVVQTGANLTYTPPTDYVGSDLFTYTLTDQIDYPVGKVFISVVQPLAPRFGGASVSGNSVVFSGSGGAPGGSFTVLTSSNVADPVTNWTILRTSAFDGSGRFGVTNAIAAGVPQNYYRLVVP